MFCAVSKLVLPLLGALCAVLFLSPASGATTKPKATPAPAAAPGADPGPAKPLGSAGSWNAYLAQNRSGKVCYLVSQPEKSDPAVARKRVMAMITHRTADNVSNVVSFDEGYPLNESDDVVLEVGPDKFTLFAKDDTAWARTADLDKTIVAALAKEKQAVVKATPKKGRATTDVYSLAGFSKALSLIDKACDVKR
jgi:Invasion associated locus B (IalB) protein